MNTLWELGSYVYSKTDFYCILYSLMGWTEKLAGTVYQYSMGAAVPTGLLTC